MNRLTHLFDLNKVDKSWLPCLKKALATMDQNYLIALSHDSHWLPGPDKLFNAFSLPVNQVNYVLLGESPYPRIQSANGYSFWDASVNEIWSTTGLSKNVNRATSLRHLIKMMLIAEEKITPAAATQPDIANIDKSNYVQTNNELFNNFLKKGFLLLNATPILQKNQVKQDAKQWLPFIQTVLQYLLAQRPEAKFVLLGQIANIVNKLFPHTQMRSICAEHPYNISFIANKEVINFFQPLQLLVKD